MRGRTAAGAVAVLLAVGGLSACSTTVAGQAQPVSGVAVTSGAATATSSSSTRTPSSTSRTTTRTTPPTTTTSSGGSSIVACSFIFTTTGGAVDDVNAYIDTYNAQGEGGADTPAAKAKAVSSTASAADAVAGFSISAPDLRSAATAMADTLRGVGVLLQTSTEEDVINPALDDFNAKYDVVKTICQS